MPEFKGSDSEKQMNVIDEAKWEYTKFINMYKSL